MGKETGEISSSNAFFAKVFFTASLLSIMVLEVGVIHAPYIVLYFYSLTFFPLFLYRVITYWKLKQQLFLLDPCYFINIFSVLVVWAAPYSAPLLQLQFGFSHGPVLWAPLVYRNSLVLNDIERMTSAYIHVLPALTGFVLRWRSEAASLGWYSPIASSLPPAGNSSLVTEQLRRNHYSHELWVWTTALPMAYFFLHSVCYVVVVHLVLRPSEEYLDSYKYMEGRADIIGAILRRAQGKCRIFVAWLGIFGVGSLQYLLVPLWASFLAANTVAVALQFVLVVWNGATYQEDVYRKALRTSTMPVRPVRSDPSSVEADSVAKMRAPDA